MRILDRYVCREVVSHALLGLAVFTFVFFVPQLVRLMELLVQHTGTARQTALIFFSSLPQVLTFTLPISMLVGALIGLGRLSADSEIVALNASGVSLRRLLVPIGAIALAATAVTLGITLWIAPISLRTLRSLETLLRASRASFAVQPRVFDERFPHIVLYVQDVSASGTQWRGVLLAESDNSANSKITLAKSAIVMADAALGKLEIHLDDVTSHELNASHPARYTLSTSALQSTDIPLADATALAQTHPKLTDSERSVRELLAIRGTGEKNARIELQRRLAFPAACLLFAFLGVPVGVRPKRGGRALGFVLSVVFISAYYLLLVVGIHFAQQGRLTPFWGVWAANIATLLFAVFLLTRIERIRPEARSLEWVRRLFPRGHKTQPETAAPVETASLSNGRAPLQLAGWRPTRYRSRGFPLILDLYVLRTFVYWLGFLLAAFIVISDAFTLFDLLDDISKNHASIFLVADYFAHLLPFMLYQLLPLAALVATLITLGLLAKNNEVTALKASGISLYRLALPLLLVGLVLSACMFLMDDTFLPYANQRQDALRNQIMGRPAQTYFQPAHEWIFGKSDKVYNYGFFDPDRNLFGGLNVFELDPTTFQMRRRIYANRAYWAQSLDAWVLESGWVRDFSGARVTNYRPFRVDSFPELNELPSYFKRQVRQYYQMNWWQLRNYIRGLQQAGFDTSRLSVEWHKKFAYPLITTIIIFLAIPFAFLVGTRGAVGGLALAIGIAIVYWASAALFEAFGAVGQLPPFLAAWSPDAIFAFLGLYFFLKMQT